MTRTNAFRGLWVLVTFMLIAVSCSSGTDLAEPQPADPTPGAGTENPDPTSTQGEPVAATVSGPLTLRLSAGTGSAEDAEPVNVVDGESLSNSEVQEILGRLPDWVQDEDDVEDFKRPAETLPPPRTGETIESTFPASLDTTGPEPVETGPLEVLRFQPEGSVDVAPTISVTFNQPMVPLATLSQLDVTDVPVIVTPDFPGRWQWIGTRTLRFEYESDLFDRLPMATSYTVEVPAGTTSASGGELAEALRWEFETPTVQVLDFSPQHEGLDLDPVFVVRFDQRVDAAAVLETVSLRANGGDRSIRLATDSEVADDETAASRMSSALPDRAVAFVASEPFEPDTAISVTVGPNTPSSEGPRTSPNDESFAARTYAPLRVQGQNCQGNDRCYPSSQLNIWFNNALDPDLFDPTKVKIEPELAGAVISAQGSSILITGTTQGSTTYEITLPAGLKDVWGQTLGEDLTLNFDIGAAEPRLFEFESQFITTDPFAESPTVSVTSVNHDRLKLDVYRMQPSDWGRYIKALEGQYEEEGKPDLSDWDRVLSTEVDVDGREDGITETLIPLEEALDGESGQMVVVVSPTKEYSQNDNNYWSNRPTMVWVQVTNIALDVFTDRDEMVAWTTDLATGEPLDGVAIELTGTGISLTTDQDGLATTELTTTSTDVVTATNGTDVAMLASPYDSFQRGSANDFVRFHVFDDRGIYRPGETVNVKGWARRLTLSGDAQLLPIGDTELSYTVFDPQGNEIASANAPVSALGGFDFAFDIPAGANLGPAWIDMSLSGISGVDGSNSAGHSFQIQDFRRPEFEVSARNESSGPYLRTEPATVAVEANYFSGGPLPNAPVNWTVTTSDASYSPPNWEDFTFGTWVPWWIAGPYFDDGFGGGRFEGDYFEDDYYFGEEYFGGPGYGEDKVEQFSGLTDASGTHYLQIDFEGDETDQPVTVTAESTVEDVNRQAWASSTSLLVHPADLYVGLRGERTFVNKGDPLEISTVVTDIDGGVASGKPVLVEASRLDWRFQDGEWTEVAVATQTCEITSESEPVGCAFTTDEGGKYSITATVTDDQGRNNRSELTRWVSGGNARPTRNVEQEEVTLIPDKAEYEPGDTAEILVEAPFSGGQGLLTITRNGIVSTSTVQFDGSTTVVSIPIADADIPNLNIQVDVVGAAERVGDDGAALPDAPERPAFAVGRLVLAIPPISRTLLVTADPAATTIEPGSDTSVSVTVTDAGGSPVQGAELAVIVVDEAVLALSNYQLRNPIDTFYGQIGSDLRSRYARASLVLDNPLSLGEGDNVVETAGVAPAEEESASDDYLATADVEFDSARASGGDLADGGSNGSNPPIDVRTNFDALAVFAPEETTGADGTVTIDVPLPDNLTRYRVMVVAVDGADQFGSAESNITARLPLMVRPSAPRFLNFGDQFELPVVVQNQTDEPMEVDVVLQTSNLLATEREGTRVTVPANDRVEVRFAATTDNVGTARFRVVAVSAEASDAATVSLPVYTPATSEAFATYGVVDNEGTVLQPVLAPTDVWPQFGGLEINTSSTALQALTDAVIYISDYPYESTDARASRILAIAALRDVLDAFDAGGLPSASQLNATVQGDIDAIAALQNGDGGFPIWKRWNQSWPYHSVQVTHALVEAKNNGYDVPAETLNRALEYVRNVESFYPSHYSEFTRNTISAYALNVRRLAGDTDSAKAVDLYRSASDGQLSLDAAAWLWPVVDNAVIETEIERLFNNRATETAGAATFATNYREDAYLVLGSNRRTDGVILDALISQAPDSDLIPKVVAGLLGNQTRGRWNNMQENTFILLALNNYFDTFEAEDPDFVARIWLGNIYAAEDTYEGRSTERNETIVPMAELIAQGDSDLVVSKDGADGRLYYRLGLRYAPSDLNLDPLDRGFVVSRTYEGVDDPDDVSLDDDGVWRIKAGAQVRVRLAMVADSRRTHVALVDPLPAGLEALNPNLAVTPDIDPDPSAARSTYYYWRWFTHQNLRDDRAEAFATILYAGTYEYTYVTRATTPGTFVTPPAKAEEMYAPETFGRSGTDIVIVE